MRRPDLPKHLVNNNWKQFGPRLGFAYRALRRDKGVRSCAAATACPITRSRSPTGSAARTTSRSSRPASQNSVTNTALSPDGLPNYGLRTVPQYIAGVNTPQFDHQHQRYPHHRARLHGGSARSESDGSQRARLELTIEKEIVNNMVVRFAYVGKLLRQHPADDVSSTTATPAYIWYVTTPDAAADWRVCRRRHAAL